MNDTYLVAGSKPWSRTVFEEELRGMPGRWELVTSPDELFARTAALEPAVVFLLHWSWKVPKQLLERYELVGFHMTDLPFGRGGSPLQNLIQRGFRTTKLTAFRLTDEMDAGPIYLQEELSLEGGAEEIYIRASRTAAGMIRRFLDERPEPRPQSGSVEVFRRRRPADSAIGDQADLVALYDFVRMLDADGYPEAYLDHGGFRFRFRRGTLYDRRIEASVVITRKEES